MRKFNTIIASDVEPNINDLWLHEGSLKYFGNNGWETLVGGSGGGSSDIPAILLETASRNRTKDISEIDDNLIQNMYVFSLNNTKKDKDANLLLAADILFDKVEAVLVIGSRNGIEYNTIGVYHDGYITALQKNEYVVFNVSFEDGSITIETLSKVDKMLPYVEIMIGDSEEVKQFNAENIPNGEFFLHSNYGYGVGTYQDDRGGFAHITSAYGNELFYTINMDGSIMPDRDYVKPNEPYTLTLNADRINKQLTDIESSALKKAGEIVIITSSGPITYTRTTDSNENMVYFTDDRKDGQVILLTYNNTNKMLTVSEVPMKKATQYSIGGITQGAAISNATGTNAVEQFNKLLAELRKAGVIAE